MEVKESLERESKEKISDDGEKKDGTNLKDLFNTSSKLVMQAASILEEEIASGIVAAKKAENKLINVKRIRSGDKDDLSLRFRKDAHEVIDIIMDMATAAGQYINKLPEMDIAFGKEKNEKKYSSANDGIQTINLTEEVAVGKSAVISMQLDNASTVATEEFNLYCTDIVNPAGARIAYRSISFSPDKIKIPPKSSSKVEVLIKVPKAAVPGRYSGLIQAHNMEAFRAILVINVV